MEVASSHWRGSSCSWNKAQVSEERLPPSITFMIRRNFVRAAAGCEARILLLARMLRQIFKFNAESDANAIQLPTAQQ